MRLNLFGFTIGQKEEEKESQKLPSIVPANQEDGSVEIGAGGAYGLFVDLEGTARNEADLVTKYRQMSTTPEADSAIQDIVNEAITIADDGAIVDIVLDNLKYSVGVKKKIEEEFQNILKLLDFENRAYDIFKKWYVDGRLYYHIMIDEKNPRNGIQELRNIDPRRIKKVRESIKEKDPRTGAVIYKGANEFYIYNQAGINSKQSGAGSGVKISKDSICYVHSGVLDIRNSTVYSHLHKAIKPLNQLRMLEDAVVIYRIARAPERRIFYIDVGNLPKAKAEQYMRDMMARHKNKLVYDAETGQVRDDRKHMTMLEDFWLPRREGGKGTEISSLPGGQNLGEMEDVEYFRRKLYKSLNVPITRLDSENSFNLGRSTEVTRDEVKFSKFVNRLRARFSMLFDDLLETQLILKGVTTRKEWKEMKQLISYDFQEDNHFTELKETEIMRERASLLNEVDAFTGKYVSREWVMRNILRFTDEEIREELKKIDKEEPEEPVDGAGNDQDQAETQPDEKQPSGKSVHIKVEEFTPKEELSEDESELIQNMMLFLEEDLDEVEDEFTSNDLEIEHAENAK